MKERGGNLFITSYKACQVQILNKNYVLTIIYTTATGIRGMVQMTCPAVETTTHTTSTTTIGKPVTTGKPTTPTLPPTPVCKASSMTVALPSGSLQVLLLNLSNEWVDVNAAPSYCNYSLVQGRGGRNFFTAPYRACDVRIQDGSYILTLLYVTIAKGGYVHMRCPIKTTTRKPTKTSRTTPRKTTSIPIIGVTEAPATVVCTASSMVVELPNEPLRLVKVLDQSNQWVAVIDAPKYCNYTLLQGRGGNFFITPYTACDVRILNNNYVLKIWYLATGGKKGYMVMTCPTGAGEPTKAPTTTWEPTKTRTTSRKTTTTIGEPTRTTSGKTTKAPTTVVCTASSMVVELPNEPLRLVKVLGELSFGYLRGIE
ncbi:hypothetical protein AOXY_G38742 [Acipenser oxyrinchus oxyrinchus]|uniref:Uncharacterized protein n=1 Tax=Acipenser oxyrinchus oxyrinchus TaxID=40147 RepID=A0AAD8FPA5_ACIOX|nr:hypothetical protein AOXY_G38742 [Acipenser oxyrinchus oxyrinchus]